jgi:meiosis induction protein kinase IME2/SME1
MTVVYDAQSRAWPHSSSSALCLEDRFEVLKEIGDGSFGSVALARVRSAGANVARRGTLVSYLIIRDIACILTTTRLLSRR